MKFLTKMMLTGVALLLGPQLALAEMNDLGKREYEQNCAICHGIKGKGDGPLSGYLEHSVPDLTSITERTDGVFPFGMIVEIIDGRRLLVMHGPEDMPAWGNEYNEKAVEYYRDFPGVYNAESFIQARVIALAEYLHRLQM